MTASANVIYDRGPVSLPTLSPGFPMGNQVRKRAQLHPIWRMPTDATTNWVPYQAAAALDTDNVIASMAATRASLKLTCSGVGSAGELDNTSLTGVPDLTDTTIRVRYKIATADVAKINSIQLRLGSAANNEYRWTIHDGSYQDGTQHLGGGWCECWAPVAAATIAGTPDPAAITRASLIVLLASSSSTAAVTFCDVCAYAKPTRVPRHFLTFDDWDTKQLDAARYLTAIGVRATFFAITSRITTATHLDQLRQAELGGHTIGNHSRAHWYTDAHTVAEVWRDAENGCYDLTSWGVGQGLVYAIPGGTAADIIGDASWQQQLKRYDVVRNTASGAGGVFIVPPNGNKVLYTQQFDGTEANLRAKVDRSIACGWDTCVGIHDPTAITDVTDYFDYLKTCQDAGTIRCCTVDEFAFFD